VRFALLAEQLGQLRRGQAVDKPRYDFVTHLPMAQSERVAPRPLILLDGTLILHDAQVRAMIDYAVFVRASEQVRFARRLRRDVAERGRIAESIRDQFARFVAPMHERFVEPSAVHAEVLIDNDTEPPAPFADRPMVQRIIADVGKKLAGTTVS
jgi:uridine kinase